MMAKSADFWKDAKFSWFVIFSWMVVPGTTLFAIALLVPSTDWLYALVALAGFLLMAPFFFHLNLLAIWHWKGRYLGTHSKLWGALLIFEATGWFKLFYLFRHVLPDRRKTGRYSELASAPPPPLQVIGS
jgi:hypothetical protein